MTVLISILYSGRYVTLETNKTLKMKLSVVIQVYFSVSILKLTLYVGVKRDDDDDDDDDNNDDDAVVVVDDDDDYADDDNDDELILVLANHNSSL